MDINKKNILICHEQNSLQKELHLLIQQYDYFKGFVHEREDIFDLLVTGEYSCLISDKSCFAILEKIDNSTNIRLENKIIINTIGVNSINFEKKVASNFIFIQTILPIKFDIFVNKIKRNIFLSEKNKVQNIIIGKYIFIADSKIMVNKEDKSKVIKLTDKESSIIEYLSEKTNQLVTRDVLLKEVWGYDKSIDTHTLETHIYKLRRKIEEDHRNPKFLTNEEGGYKLNYLIR